MSNRQSKRTVSVGRRHAQGLSLVELMVSLVLGLLVTGAAINVFVSNRQTYRATESLGRVQENARVAFELMARDVREAGGNPCAKDLPVANILNGATTLWWTNWGDGIRGAEGAFAQEEPANRVGGTDAVELMSAYSNGVTVAEEQKFSPAAQFKVNTVNHGLEDGDIAMVCDNRQLAIFQVTNAQPGTNTTVVHNSGNTVSPGNCTSKGMGVPVPTTCNNSTGGFTPYVYGANSQLVKVKAVRWYVGTNDRGGNSLYRIALRNSAPGAPEEVADGVEDMQITYLLPGANAYVNAAGVGARWKEVLAARIDIQLEGEDRIGPAGEVIGRRLVHTVTLRNRNT
jgi:type IV pilus assembly protein PilW